MPYIKQERRIELSDQTKIDLINIDNPGELNYMFTVLTNRYMQQHGLNYQHINDVLGAFTGASDEFYRRVAVPYENQKIKENGDVYLNENLKI